MFYLKMIQIITTMKMSQTQKKKKEKNVKEAILNLEPVSSSNNFSTLLWVLTHLSLS